MITLTDKETKLVDYLLANTDGSDGHLCSEQFMDLKELGWSMETLKGVFGSLVNKQILYYENLQKIIMQNVIIGTFQYMKNDKVQIIDQ